MTRTTIALVVTLAAVAVPGCAPSLPRSCATLTPGACLRLGQAQQAQWNIDYPARWSDAFTPRPGEVPWKPTYQNRGWREE